MLSSSRTSPFGSSTCVRLTKSVVAADSGLVDRAEKFPSPIWPISGVSPVYVQTRFGMVGVVVRNRAARVAADVHGDEVEPGRLVVRSRPSDR